MKRCLKWADYNGRACVSGAAREQRHSSTHTRAIMSGGCSYVSGAGGARRTGDGEGKGESMGWSFAALWTAVGLVLGSNIGVLLRRGHVIRGPAQGGYYEYGRGAANEPSGCLRTYSMSKSMTHWPCRGVIRRSMLNNSQIF